MSSKNRLHLTCIVTDPACDNADRVTDTDTQTHRHGPTTNTALRELRMSKNV